MLNLEKLPSDTESKPWFLGFTDSLDSLLAPPPLPHSQFVLFLAVLGTEQHRDNMFRPVAESLLKAGACYVLNWGPKSDQLEEVFDFAAMDLVKDETDENVVLTTSHREEPLSEALWFALYSAFPASAYHEEIQPVVVIVVGDRGAFNTARNYIVREAPNEES